MENRTHLISERDAVDNSDITTWALPEGAIARLGRGREPDITFSPDGQYISIGNSLGLWMYDLETLSPIALWDTERGMVFHVAFSPNGKCIATSNSDEILKILDIQNGVCLTQIETDDYISGLTFSPDNQYIAAAYANSSTVEIWYAETCEPLSKFTSDTEKAGFYRPISFSPDSQLIASTCRNSKVQNADAIVVWDVEKDQQIASLAGHTYWVTTLCFSPCGQFLASGGEDGTVCVWDVETWQQVQCYTDYGNVYRIIPSYSPDGILRAAIVNYDETGPATISVRDLESDEQLYNDQFWGNTVQFSDAGDWGNTVVFSNGSQLAYECRHEFINVWTSDNPTKRQFTHSPISFPTSAIFSQDGKTLAVQHHHEGVMLWDIESKRSRPAIKDASAGKNQFVYKTSDGRLYVASIKENNVGLWEADSDGILLIEGTGREYWSAFPALSPIGKFFAYAGADGNIQVWDVQNGKKLYELTHPLELSDDDDDEDDDGDSIRELEFSYNGKLLASESKYRNVRLWDLELGEEIDTFPSDSVTGFRFSPCGQYLVCFGIEEILIWDITHRKLCKDEKIFYDLTVDEIGARLSLPREYEGMHAKAFSSCENYFAAGAWWQEGMEKMVICLWEVETGKQIVTLRGHPTDVQALAFSPDNKLLASASYDGTILLWDLMPYL